jgi:SAM-dependent methyltransferase
MVPEDVQYLRRMIGLGWVQSACLELGVGYEGPTNKELVQAAGIVYVGTDIVGGPNVEVIADFEAPCDNVIHAFEGLPPFGSAIVFNVLEHTFAPITVIDNVFALLRPGGTCLILTPTVWPLHNFPLDCWRINPGFYEEYARRRGVHLAEASFEYVGRANVTEARDTSGALSLPRPTDNRTWRAYSRLVHRLFNTYGRRMRFPSHLATAVVLRKPNVG